MTFALDNAFSQYVQIEHKYGYIYGVFSRATPRKSHVGLAEQRIAIHATIHDPTITKQQHRYLDLKDHQWKLLSQLVTALKPLQMATTVFSSDLNVSCSIVYPVINGLLSNHLVISEDDVSAVKRRPSRE